MDRLELAELMGLGEKVSDAERSKRRDGMSSLVLMFEICKSCCLLAAGT
jgi:hypothetical protein